ncbi:MAG TPA: sugar transferase [Egibacteraceae bacterium]
MASGNLRADTRTTSSDLETAFGDVVLDLTTDETVIDLSVADAPALPAAAPRPALPALPARTVEPATDLDCGLLAASRLQLAAKRAIDIVVSLLALLLTLPIFAITALLIAVTSPGPVFYVQERIGRGGIPFRMLKFRSMYVDADKRKAELAALNEASGPVFKVRRDPRVTPVGRWIRKLSIDELPQLINVLRGEMSLVGPRPPLPEEYAVYDAYALRRLLVSPGLTCIWQVSGRSNIDFDQWVEMDVEYIRNWSLALDVKLLLKTVPAVLSGHGAY